MSPSKWLVLIRADWRNSRQPKPPEKYRLKRDGSVFFSSAPVKVVGDERTIIAQRDAGPNWRGVANYAPVRRSSCEGLSSEARVSRHSLGEGGLREGGSPPDTWGTAREDSRPTKSHQIKVNQTSKTPMNPQKSK